MKGTIVIELKLFKRILKENEDKFPLLTLDEFFDGNIEEYSIAPNQWGDGRPSLDEMWERLREIEQMPNVAWVRVALHDDTEITEDKGKEVLNLAGESIIVCTDMLSKELEEIADCEWLCSDGVLKLKPALYYSCVPEIPKNYHCLEIMWD